MKRIHLVIFILVITIAVALLAARHPTGPNTISYDDPLGLGISLGLIIVVFIPPLILSLSRNIIARIITAIYIGVIAVAYLGLLPMGFLFDEHLAVSILAGVGFIVCIASAIIILRADQD